MLLQALLSQVQPDVTRHRTYAIPVHKTDTETYIYVNTSAQDALSRSEFTGKIRAAPANCPSLPPQPKKDRNVSILLPEPAHQ